MKFDELLKSRRSIRNFQDREVTVETIKELINESIFAPSAGNGQPWKFIVVTNKDVMKRISDDGKKNILNRIAGNPNDFAKRYESMLQKEVFNVFYNAPAVVFILGKANLKNLHVDCALAASYFMMSAANHGLGTCWVNFAMELKDPELLKELKIPGDHKIVAPIALGYPAAIPPIPNRKEPEIINIIS